jgi:hypothetical protein
MRPPETVRALLYFDHLNIVRRDMLTFGESPICEAARALLA